jgi:hypothetical protein
MPAVDSFPGSVRVFSNQIRENHEEHRQDTFNDDWYGSCCAGIAEPDAGKYPRSRTDRNRAGKEINEWTVFLRSQDQKQKDKTQANHHRAKKPEVGIQKQRGLPILEPAIAKGAWSCRSEYQSWPSESEKHQQT